MFLEKKSLICTSKMKLLAIILSNLILFQSLNIDLDSFSKLNVLLEHAQFHQEKYGDSFLEFITDHYGEQENKSANDHKEHKDLPFKKDSKTCSHLISDFSFGILQFELKTKISLNTKPSFFYKETYSSHEKPSVFQPPKQA